MTNQLAHLRLPSDLICATDCGLNYHSRVGDPHFGRIEMKTLYRIRLVSLIALVASVVPIASVVPVTSTRIRPISTLNSSGSAESRNSITVHADRRGNPWIKLSDGRELL